MKLAKFIYPMFLVAIGLHGLLLFVPVGDASEADPKEEDEITLGELPIANSSEIVAEDTPLNALPAANSEISSGAVVNPNQPAVVGAPVAVTARQPAVATARTAASSRALSPVQPNPPSRSRAGQAATATHADSPNNDVSNAGTSAAASLPHLSSTVQPASTIQPVSPSANAPRTDTLPATKLPDLSAARSATTSTTHEARQPASVADLIASARGTVSQALKALQSDFAAEFAYVAKGTDDASADSNRADWIASISRQVNAAASGEHITPTQIAEPIQLSYPIETSKQAGRRSFRVCLTLEPHMAEVGVLFDSQGNLVDEPEIIRSTGYLAVNNEILAIAAEPAAFPEDRQSKAYTLAFEIDYVAERCTSLEKLVDSAGDS